VVGPPPNKRDDGADTATNCQTRWGAQDIRLTRGQISSVSSNHPARQIRHDVAIEVVNSSSDQKIACVEPATVAVLQLKESRTRLPELLLAGALVAVGLTAGLCLSGCGRAKQGGSLPPNAVAVVGDQVITAEAFQTELARRARLVPGRGADPKEKQALLEEMIRQEVLYQKALAAGYDQDPQIVAGLKRMIAARFQEDQLARLGRPKISPEDIADYYRKNPERFGTPEKVRAALIEIKVARTASSQKRADTAKMADTLLAEARATATPDGTFGLLAQMHSEDQASRYRGGDIGWLTVGDTNLSWDPAVTAAIFKLAQPGELAPVIETPAAFYLVKLVERQPASLRSLEEVKDGIEYLVAREKEQQQQENIHARAKQELSIRINQGLLDSIASPVKAPPPAVPGVATAQSRREP
jgi:parvulin-like peptidyl-prolyl isomerase